MNFIGDSSEFDPAFRLFRACATYSKRVAVSLQSCFHCIVLS
jgi:hypothetical protein